MKLIQRVRNWLVLQAFKILDKSGIRYYIVKLDELQKAADRVVEQIEEKFGSESGEFKRAQAMRSLMNILPNALERDIAMAIELAVRRVSRTY